MEHPPDRERCRAELAHASVGIAPGLGPIDVLAPTCGPGDTLTLFALRGHTLSRLSRSLAPGAGFTPPDVLATGADQLGPIEPNAPRGPLVWRSPPMSLDETESDEWWAAVLDPSRPGAGVLRGSVRMPPGALGTGILAPLGLTSGGVDVLGTIARTGKNPVLVRHTVRVPSDSVEALAHDPVPLTEGELRAWEPTGRVALLFAMTDDGIAQIRAVTLSPDGVHERGRIPLRHRHAWVLARGVFAHGASLFALSDFDTVRPEDGPCATLGPDLCVRPGPPTFVRVSPSGVTTVALGPTGLVDSLALDAQERALVLYLDPSEVAHPQHAVRVDPDHGAHEILALHPSDELPPLDQPGLLRCGGQPWLVATVLVEPGRADGGAEAGEPAVFAAPFGCFVGW